jgi:hypothetical protein
MIYINGSTSVGPWLMDSSTFSNLCEVARSVLLVKKTVSSWIIGAEDQDVHLGIVVKVLCNRS